MSAPYNEAEESITLNTGELALSVDDMFIGVPLSMLACSDDMQTAYNSFDFENNFGLHTDEVARNMRDYPDIA